MSNFGKDDLVELKEMKDESLNGAEAVITKVFTQDGSTRYEVYINGYGEWVWLIDEQMDLIERNQAHLIEEWKAE